MPKTTPFIINDKNMSEKDLDLKKYKKLKKTKS